MRALHLAAGAAGAIVTAVVLIVALVAMTIADFLRWLVG